MATMQSNTLTTTAYDLPSPLIMALSRSNSRRPSGIDWSSFSAQPFTSISKILEHYRKYPSDLTHALRHLAGFVLHVQSSAYNTLKYGKDPDFHERWCKSVSFQNQIEAVQRDISFLPIFEEAPLMFIEDVPVDLASCLEQAGLEEVYSFVMARTKAYDKLENYSLDFEATAQLEALEWIVSCALYSGLDISLELRHALQPYLVQQPSSEQPLDQLSSFAHPLFEISCRKSSDYLEQRRLRTSSGCAWPVLHNTLLPFVKAKDDEAIQAIVLEFLRVGNRAMAVYLCRAFPHWVWSLSIGQPLLEEEYKEGVNCLFEEYTSRLMEPASETPLRVRKVLTQLDFGGLWQWLFRFVFPTITRYQSTATLRYFFFRWLLRAAMSTQIGDASTVKDALGKIFKLDIVLQQPSHIPTNEVFDASALVGTGKYRDAEDGDSPFYDSVLTPYKELDFHGDTYLVPDACLDLEREWPGVPELHLQQRSHVQVLDFMQLEPTPADDEVCPICRCIFVEEDSLCYRLDVCKHLYHAECLQGWADSLPFGEARCPYCTKFIDVEGGREPRPLWANPAWWKVREAKRLEREAEQGF
jgi:hypothetical protein